ncbi:thiamine-phosphate diphosphorylase [Pedobacter psychrotolerans]|uniref:Thiamine-phosphate synthase n=1 Tax=Pedobacter psychrotolerans TaxID=1843235 RepID=A0A4R2H8L8_9SPHI|nr:thiamine phosphate synthase [Pedobacter psychrotolerans]TCO22591.1 thiamine-phosphate diphosphorylase [Pedobacter psychrotolerans]GGE65722.1 thiamine-phosphate synthase [Pedobacter psychrotolerans]
MIDRLHYISQEPENGTHLTAIKVALEAGAKWIQLRVKNQPKVEILQYAIDAVALCQAYGAKLIVNDHPEIALKAGAYGLHLGLDDMPIKNARDIVGKEMIIGGTANTFDHIKRRVSERVDYIGLGPYRFTTTKQKLSPILGLDGYAAIIKQVKLANIHIPIIAIGGIELGDINAIIKTGLYGVAVSGAITHATDHATMVRQMYAQLNSFNLKEV